MELPRKPFEDRRELRRLLRDVAGHSHGDTGRVAAVIGERDRSEVGVLDRPAFAGDRGDRHVQRSRVALPGNHNRSHVGLRAGEVLDGARYGARGAGGAELESLHEPRTGAEDPEREPAEPGTRTPNDERRTGCDAKLAQW